MHVVKASPHIRIQLAVLGLALALVTSAYSQAPQPDEASIIRAVDAAVEARLSAIAGYTVTEHYAVYRNSDKVHPVAERTVKTTYRSGIGKNYEIISDSGSELIRKLVLDAILDNEKRINTPPATDNSYIISKNYEMKLQPGGPQHVNGRDCYVLSISPREKAPNLIVGTLWVDTKDESIVQLEGTTSKSVSVFTGPTKVMRQYAMVDGFAEATHASGASTSFLFGLTVVTIDYSDYQIQIRPSK
jgi:outer membrane lipoprotein-sorting protein